MEVKGAVMFRLLLKRFHPDHPKSLLQILPKEESVLILDQATPQTVISTAELQPETLINRVHYSWLLLTLEKMPKSIIRFIVSALPSHQAEKIEQHLQMSPSQHHYADVVKAFFLNKIYNALIDPAVLPLDFLPKTPLSFLTSCTKQQLMEIINLLGIYDLAEEVRYILNKESLNKVHVCLTARQRQFLRQTLHQKEKVSSSPLNLKQWDGDCKKLAVSMHRRGLVRLGKALFGQHPDFIWHLTHILDTGRGAIIKSHYSLKERPEVAAALTQQVLSVMKFMNLKDTA